MKILSHTTLWLALVFGGLGAYFSYSYAEQPPVAEVLYTAKLRPVSVKDSTTSSEAASLRQYRNRLLVVNFWATWCPPCINEIDDLMALQKKWGQRLTVIGLGIDTMEKMTPFAQTKQITYPLFEAHSEGYALSTQLGNTTGGIPFTVLIDQSGHVVNTYPGQLEKKMLQQLEKDIAAHV